MYFTLLYFTSTAALLRPAGTHRYCFCCCCPRFCNKFWTARGCQVIFGWSSSSRRPTRHHLADFGCSVVGVNLIVMTFLWVVLCRLSLSCGGEPRAISCCTRPALHEVIIWDFECCDVCSRQCCWLLVKFINLGTSKLCLGVWKQQIVAAEGIEGQFWPYFSKFSRESSTIKINFPRGFLFCGYHHYYLSI